MKSSLYKKIKLINWLLLLRVFFTTLVPNYIIVSYSLPLFMNFNKKILNFSGIPYNNDIFLCIFILFIFIIPFLIHNIKWFNLENKYKEENILLKKIMFGINSVVDIKKKRFHESKNKDISNSGVFFKEITQPDMQIANICSTIANLIKGYTNDEQIKLSLIMCQNEKFNSYLYISDESSSVKIKDMNQKATTARESMLKQIMIIIENVDNIKKEDVFWKAPKSKIKSVITYPICSGGKTVFVVCISSKQSDTFQKKNEKLYDFILEEFSRRILLESYLLEIRKKCHDI